MCIYKKDAFDFLNIPLKGNVKITLIEKCLGVLHWTRILREDTLLSEIMDSSPPPPLQDDTVTASTFKIERRKTKRSKRKVAFMEV